MIDRAGESRPAFDPPPSRRWKRLRLALALSVASLAAAVVLPAFPFVDDWLWRSSGGFYGRGTDHPTRAEIEAIARIALPPDATEVRAAVGGFQDPWALVRFRLPVDRVSPFLKGLRYTPTWTPGDGKPRYLRDDPDRPWWIPEAARRFREGHCEAASFVQSILIDEDDPENSVLFIDSRKL